jgi:phage tail-like protein
MARSEPVSGHDFDVDLGDGSQSAFVSVVFPEFRVDGDGQGPLVLRRALSEDRELQKWWSEGRETSSLARNIAVTLVKGAERAPVLRWRFIDARPVSLGYSPLDAMHSALVFEVLTLSFERVEIE